MSRVFFPRLGPTPGGGIKQSQLETKGQRSWEELAWIASLATHKEAWELLGDQVATSIMTTGLKLEFHTPPPLSYTPSPRAITSERNAKLIRPFIPDWLKRGVCRKIKIPQLLYFSSLFAVEKDEVSHRPIII